MLYFTADTHFFDHKLVFSPQFANREFLTVAQMDQTIIDNWNQTISPLDTVYHLGDLALIPSKKVAYVKVLEILRQLHGQIILIKGNHDTRALFKFLEQHNYLLPNQQKKFAFHDVGCILKFDHYQFFLTHYPLLLGISKNGINLHGHIHHNSLNSASNLNVGVDTPEKDYLTQSVPFGAPFSQAQILEMVQQKKIDFQKSRF
jgi:calcineurin-like phosphoesterase family protein